MPSEVDDDETRGQAPPGREPEVSPLAVERKGPRSTAEVRPLVEYVPPGATRPRSRVGLWPVLAMLVLGMAAGLYFGLPAVLKARRTPVTVPVGPSRIVATQQDAAPAVAPVEPGLDAAFAGIAADGGTATARPALSTEEVSRLLGAARKAAAARRWVAPAGDCVRDYLARIEEAQPGDPDATTLRAKIAKGLHRDGDVYLKRRKYDEAEATFRGLYGLDPQGEHAAAGLTRALLARSELELKRRRYDAAATDAKEAVALGDVSGRGHVTLGEALLKKGAYHDAVEAFRRAVELRPRNRDAKKGLLRAEKLAAAADKATRGASPKVRKVKEPVAQPPRVERRKGKK
ncbi:MAG: tetratricopeptide repeat protein [Deltaproteobacteria bacterium]|nr:tetratricopeptide repeat protein [Deltaproteobacteria bacterium]